MEGGKRRKREGGERRGIGGGMRLMEVGMKGDWEIAKTTQTFLSHKL